MKSKTSCFNRTIFKKNITHYWPVWALYLAYLLLIMPYSLWRYISAEGSYYFEEYNKTERGYIFLEIVLNSGLMPMIIFIMSVIVAMFLFSYLYTARNTNMIHALPVTRLELFGTNYLSGIVFLLVPQMITFFVTVLVCVAGQITCIQYLFYWLLYAAGMSIFAFSLAVFVAMFTGQKAAMFIYYFIINFLYVGCVQLLSTFQQIVSWGKVDYLTPGKLKVLSPLYYLILNVGTTCIYDEMGMPCGIGMNGGAAIGIYAAVGIVLAVIAYQLYKRRQLETAGDMVSIGIVKPIFRWGVALCGGFTISMIVIADSFYNVASGRIYIYFMLGIIISGSICFFIAQMLLEKNFRVFKKKRLIECGVFCVLCAVTLMLFKVDAFGIERYQPKAEEIERAYVYMDYIIMLDTEETQDVLDIQKEIIASKDEYQESIGEEHYYYTTFRYDLKDGSRYTRRYPVLLTQEDGNTPFARLVAIEQNRDNLKQRILGKSYGDVSRYYSGSMDVYSEDGKGDNVLFDADTTAILLEAILKDIDEGNFDEYYIPCISYAADVANPETYQNTIYLERYVKNGELEDSEYYYYGMPHDQSATSEAELSIRFGEKCVHTIAALEECGIIDRTWKLMTEYEFYQAREKMD